MNTLLVVANPDNLSLTREVANRLERGLSSSSVEIADLVSEDFDPRTTMTDRKAYQGVGKLPQDVIAEQRRVEQAEHLVFIFPVYWWSMPSLLKGWIERVFTHGWAFGSDPKNGEAKNLSGHTIHLIPIAANDESSFDRRGYREAFRVQIESGIISYCGAQQGATTFIYDSEQQDRETTERNIDLAICAVRDAVLCGVPS